ncbi:MAG TPA: hypothetical protein VHC86_00840 [Opitutaceae bacterium]|nr:hypothetical protein [Opitutaceae bacterium]
MLSAARGLLRPLPPPGPEAPEIHLLTGRSLWYQTAFFLRSLQRFLPVRPVIHSDGSLEGSALASLRRVVPFARFVAPAESEERVDQFLPRSRFPSLRSRRDSLVLFRKLLDVHAGAQGWHLFCDSDMLVFHPPRALAEWLDGPSGAVHMTDVERSYGYELSLLEELAGGAVPDLVNTGILGLPSHRLDWDWLEYGCRALIERAGTHYYQEQAVVALALARLPHAALSPAEYRVLPDEVEARSRTAAVHHYVAGSKRWYFRENWRQVPL